ncbi:MAG: GNAT family N-acetyltransferase [Deltaproteobacteria bacterium]|nr:GNAT family N-acetyltransferase [Deltaproteobacteria bacterium]
MDHPIRIVPADPSAAESFSRFCQPIYEAVYPNAKYGMLPEHYSLDIFLTDDTLNYFRKLLTTSNSHGAWLAYSGTEIIGSVAITDEGDFVEARCFYVRQDLQGIGLGRRLWNEILNWWDGSKPLRVEVAETNERTIGIYERWGFRRVEELGVRLRHWPEWPEGVQNGFIFLAVNLKEAHLNYFNRKRSRVG